MLGKCGYRIRELMCFEDGTGRGGFWRLYISNDTHTTSLLYFCLDVCVPLPEGSGVRGGCMSSITGLYYMHSVYDILEALNILMPRNQR
jgi:hypothetical protein